MKAIIKKELVSAFRTGYGWFCLGVYTLLSAVVFSIFVLWQNTGYVGNYFGFWIFFVDIVFVTLLSMRLLGDEKKNRTDQLILTSPVSVAGYVTGKFFGEIVRRLLFCLEAGHAKSLFPKCIGDFCEIHF